MSVDLVDVHQREEDKVERWIVVEELGRRSDHDECERVMMRQNDKQLLWSDMIRFRLSLGFNLESRERKYYVCKVCARRCAVHTNCVSLGRRERVWYVLVGCDTRHFWIVHLARWFQTHQLRRWVTRTAAWREDSLLRASMIDQVWRPHACSQRLLRTERPVR